MAPDVDAHLDREQETELGRAEGDLVQEKFCRRAIGEPTETLRLKSETIEEAPNPADIDHQRRPVAVRMSSSRSRSSSMRRESANIRPVRLSQLTRKGSSGPRSPALLGVRVRPVRARW